MNDHEIPSNGTHVTWRELELALAPIRTTVDDIQSKMNVLTADWFEGVGAKREKRRIADSRHYWMNAAICLLGGSIGSLIIVLITQ